MPTAISLPRNLEVRASAVPIPKTFVSLIDDWYDSKWVVKKKKQEKVTKIESQFNYPINYLIGNFSKQSNDTETEDW